MIMHHGTATTANPMPDYRKRPAEESWQDSNGATTFVSDHVGLHHEPERPDPALDGVAHPLKKLKTEHHHHSYPNGTSNGNGTSDWPAYDTAAGTLTPPPTLGPLPLAPPPASLGAPASDTVVAPASPRSTTSSVHGGVTSAPRRSPSLPPAPSLPVSPSHHLPAAAAPSPPPSASLAETPVLPTLSPSSTRHGANGAAAADMDMDVDEDDAGRVPNGHRRGSNASDSSARPPPAAVPPYTGHDPNGTGYDSPHAIPVGIYSPFTALSSRGSSPDVSAAVSIKSEPGVPVAPTPAVPAALTAPPPVAAVPSAAAAAGVASVPRDTDKPMSMAQFKHALSMLRAIKRLKDAHIFLDPVDPVKLNIPDYPLIITHPMDLSTMERKLTTRAYATIDQLVADFNLMLDNCIKYNGPQSVFATMANNVRRSFERHFEKMPSATRPPPHVPSPVPARLAATAAAGATASKSSSALANKTPRSSKASSSGAGGSGGARRPSMTAASAKGESSTSASGSRASKAASAASVRRAAEELKFCQSLIRELFRKHYNDFTNPFLQPVDRKMYPSYFEVVKHPIDLSTIRKRLDDGYYANAAGFEADMQLMFRNCYQFNPIGTPVRIMGQKLEALFKQKWSERPQAQPLAQSSNSSAASSSSALPLPAAPSSSVRAASSPAAAPAASASRAKQSARSRTKPAASKAAAAAAAAAALDSESSDDDDDKLAIAQLEESVKRMQQQIEQMRARRLEKKRRRREARAREQQQLEQLQRAQMQKEQAYARTAPTSYQHPGYKGGSGAGPDAPSVAPTAAARRSAGARGGAALAAAKKSAAGRHGAGAARSGYAASSSSAAAAAAPAAPVEPVVEITYEMKRELSERINDLSAEKLQQVLTIIQESMPSLSDGQEEIELDISSLDHRTLYRLWQLVTEDAQSASPAAAAAAQQQDPPLPPLHHLAAQGGSLSSATSSSANSSTHSLPSVTSAASAPLPPLHKASGPTALSSMLGTNSSDDDGSDDESSGSDSD
ncbi:hypothetical protein GGF31_003611 [Allomyces arbusculus]|nr:hypothetical protein GGF31_003611 [Allomyces arbusculus]